MNARVRHPRLRKVRLLAVVAALGLLASACGGDSNDDATAATETNDTATETEGTADAAGALVVTADMVSGPLNIPDDQRATAVCVLDNRYPRNSEVVWRARVTDGATGEELDDTTIETMQVALADGQTFDMRFGPHPRDDPADFFWTTAWDIPVDYPTGTVGFEITVTAADGRTGTFKPFAVAPSLLTIEDTVLETIEEEG